MFDPSLLRFETSMLEIVLMRLLNDVAISFMPVDAPLVLVTKLLIESVASDSFSTLALISKSLRVVK